MVGKPSVGFTECRGLGRGPGAFDDFAMVVADELDGARGIALGDGVDDLQPRAVQRSRDPSPVLDVSQTVLYIVRLPPAQLPSIPSTEFDVIESRGPIQFENPLQSRLTVVRSDDTIERTTW